MTDTTICIGQSLDLHAVSSGGYVPDHQLSWDNGIGTGNFVKATPSSNTTYMVIVTDACTSLPDTGFVNVILRSPLKLTPRSDTLICTGQSVILYAQPAGGFAGGHTIDWEGLGTGSSFIVSPPVTTTYKVRLIDNCTVLPDSGYVTVNVRAPLKAGISTDTTICIGQSAGLITNGTGGDSTSYNFAWEFSSGGSPWGSFGQGTGITVNPSQTTAYRVILSDNCTVINDTAFVNIIVRPPLHVDAGADQLICYGQSANITATGNGGYEPSWYFIWDQGIGLGDVQTVSPKVTTTYKVVLNDFCTSIGDTDEVTINVREPLEVTPRPSLKICFGQSAQLYAQGKGGDLPNHLFSWDQGVGTGNNITVTPSQTTLYTVILTDGCSDADTGTVAIEVEQLPLPEFEAKPQIICFPDSILFKNNSQFLPQSMFSWDFGDMSTSDLQDPYHTYANPGMYDVMLKITSPFGCINNVIKPGYIIVNPKPKADFFATPDSTSILTPYIHFTDRSVGADQYLWDFNDRSGSSTLMNPDHLYEDTGVYKVSLLVTNQFGCTDIISHRVIIRDVFRFYIPNSFTPNGDMLNDEFVPAGMGAAKFKTQIFNRWGELIFESNDGKTHWNGGYYNKLPAVQDGVYTYQIMVLDFEGKSHFFSGVVHLLR